MARKRRDPAMDAALVARHIPQDGDPFQHLQWLSDRVFETNFIRIPIKAVSAALTWIRVHVTSVPLPSNNSGVGFSWEEPLYTDYADRRIAYLITGLQSLNNGVFKPIEKRHPNPRIRRVIRILERAREDLLELREQ